MKRKKEYEDEEEKETSESAAQKRSRIINSIEKNHKFLTLKDSEELMYFNPQDGQWHNGDVFLKQFVDKGTTITGFEKGAATSSYEYTTSMFREIKEIVKIHSYADPKEFVSPPGWINLKNGALNVRTSEFIPRDPEPDCKKEESEIEKLRQEMQKKIREVRETPGTVEADSIKDGIRNDYSITIKAKRDLIKKKEEDWRNSQTDKFARFSFTSTLPLKYDPSATCPKIDAFYHQIQEGDDNVKRLYELTGYLLYNEYKIKRIFILYGDHDTGKTTLTTELWHKLFLGSDTVSSLSIQSIQDDKFDRIKLKGKHANISPELPENTYIKDTSLFKALTGNDMISARLMHSQKEVKFVNFAKIIFLTNHIPMVSERDDAFFNRIEIFEFPHAFQEGVNAIADLIEEIATESELSGLLNESVKALQELLKRGKFTANKSVEEKKIYYMITSNPFKYYIEESLAFINDSIDEDDDPDGDKIKARKVDVYANYVLFCKQNKITALSDDKFFKQLNRYMVERGVRVLRDNGGTGQRYYSGVYIKKFWPRIEESQSNNSIDNL
jgi:P4 family phage/plasmid primase-like protien